jgi:hypothetical protein
MSTEPVQLFLDTFMVGLLPKDGERITKDIILSGTDGTSITVKANSSTVYKELPRKVFESISSTAVLFKFQFPIGTRTSPDSTTFTTPDKSVYMFSSGDGLQKFNDAYEKVVTEGTIKITPPEENAAGNITSKIGSTFVNNEVIQESSLGDSKFDDMKDNPFYNIALILYNVFMDMIIVVIFWMLFLSISCWLKIPSKYLYPTDISKYPFIYYADKGDDFYEFSKTDKNSICKLLETHTLAAMRTKQKDWFSELKDFEKETDKSEIMKVIYPELLQCEPKDVNLFSEILIDTCDTSNDLNTFGCLMYIIKLIVFQNFVYCSSVTSIVHSFFAAISNDILGSPKIMDSMIPMANIPVISVLFAVFLYGLFLSSDALNKEVIKLFNIKFPEETNTQNILLNKFLNLLVYFLTCCMIIFVPLFGLLLTTCLGVTSFILVKNLFSPPMSAPYNFAFWIFSFMLIISALNTYSSLILVLTGVAPVSTLTHGLGVFSGITLILSLFSIGIPIASALGYAGYISTKIVSSFFKLMNLSSVSKMMSNTVASLIIMSLILLIMRVGDRLGETYSFITIIIIILLGFAIKLGL